MTTQQRTLDRIPYKDEASRAYGIAAAVDQVPTRPVWWTGGTVLDQGQQGHCFPPGTFVRLADGSQRPIEDVRCLDEVVTAEGRRGLVTKTMVRPADELFTVKVTGHAPVRCTAEHPFLTQRGYVAASGLTTTDVVAVPRYTATTTEPIHTATLIDLRHFSGVVSGTVNTGGIMTEVAPVPELLGRTPDLGRLLGLYAAEGNTTVNKVLWSYGAHEKDTLVPETVELIKATLGAVARVQVRPNGVQQVVLYGKHWRLLFERLVPGTTRQGDKHLSSVVTQGPDLYLRGILDGWLAGDGHRRRQEYRGTSVSRRLILDMHAIATGLGLRPALMQTTPSPNRHASVRQTRYDLTIGLGGGSGRSAVQDDAAAWRRVLTVTSEPYDGWVHNLEVRGDNSYIADGLGVHNCGGFAGAAEASASPVRVRGVDDAYAHGYYYEIKDRGLDPFGREEGTSTLAVMKLGRLLGLWAGYRWAFSLDDVKRALTVGPVVLGVPWFTGMFTPDRNGTIRATGVEEGGHLLVVTGWSPDYGGRGPTYRLRQSWGLGHGKRGNVYLPEDDMGVVLIDGRGEAGVPVDRKLFAVA